MSPQPLDPVILRAARIRRGMTQSEVARAVGVAGGERVSKWELGTASPSASVRVRLARILELEVEELLPSLGAAGLRRLRVEAGLTVIVGLRLSGLLCNVPGIFHQVELVLVYRNNWLEVQLVSVDYDR